MLSGSIIGLGFVLASCIELVVEDAFFGSLRDVLSSSGLADVEKSSPGDDNSKGDPFSMLPSPPFSVSATATSDFSTDVESALAVVLFSPVETGCGVVTDSPGVSDFGF